MKGIARTMGTARGFAAAALFLAAAGIALQSGCREKPAHAPGSVPPPLVSGVETATAASSLREAYAEAIGTVRARNSAALAPQVMGRITGLFVTEGSRVAKGALLATIDDTEIRAQAAAAEGRVVEAESAFKGSDSAVAQAEAGAALAVKTHERYRKLLEDKAVTPQEFDEVEAKRTLAVQDRERALQGRAQAEARIGQARDQARAAQAMLSHTRVTAPFAGVIAEKKADAGAMAVPGTPILVLEGTSGFRLEAAIPETFLHRLVVGSKVQALLDADPGPPRAAVISEIAPVVDPMSRTFTAKADIPGGGLRGGMSGRLRFPAGKAEVVTVPLKALSRDGGVDAVFLVTPDNVARLRMVRTGRRYADDIEILSGLSAGARVAVYPVDRLVDGARVEVRR